MSERLTPLLSVPKRAIGTAARTARAAVRVAASAKRKAQTTSHYVGANGAGSFARYCACHYVTKSDRDGRVWGLSSKKRERKIIASLTSYPARIGTVDQAVKSIMAQTMKADRIILWLARDQFPRGNRDLPKQLRALKRYGLEIEWVDEDLRSHKKYHYAMERFPDDLVVTFDDDLLYYEDTIEDLYTMHLRFPECVICVRSHRMTFMEDEDGRRAVAPYMQWEMCQSESVAVPDTGLFSTSGAGTLYPPRCMDSEVLNGKAALELCADADDVWLKVMQVMRGTPVVSARPDRPLLYVPDTQDVALCLANMGGGGNDRQLGEALARYGSRRVPDGRTLRECFG